MSDKKLIQDQITGLAGRIEALRKDRDIHIRLQGLNTEAEKLRGEALGYQKDIDKAKGELVALQAQRSQAVHATVAGISKRMGEVLPVGKPCFEVSEDGVFIGWIRPNGTKVAYAGLSGGEKAAFDPALAVALKANVVIVEAAELDDTKMVEALKKYEGAGIQVLMNSCHVPAEVAGTWKVVSL